MAKRKKTKSNITPYGMKRKFKLSGGRDIPGVVTAVAEEGFYFETVESQDLANETRTFKMIFPEGPELSITFKKDDEPAYDLVRLLVAEEIL